MDITEKKSIQPVIQDFINKLKYLNNSVLIVGSSSLKSQQFTSDIDLITNCNLDLKPEKAFEIFKSILEYINLSENIYFIEFKYQNKDGKKHKILNYKKFDYHVFKEYYNQNLDFMKLDTIVYIPNTGFKELSIIYNFNDKKLKIKEKIQSLKDDYKELVNEGSYYKALKRVFSIIKEKDTEHAFLQKLSSFFNSNTGLEYQRMNNLMAIEIIFKKYKDTTTKNRIKENLTKIGLSSSKSITTEINKLRKSVNKEAKSFIDSFKLSIDEFI
jgi:hypothetical protein